MRLRELARLWTICDLLKYRFEGDQTVHARDPKIAKGEEFASKLGSMRVRSTRSAEAGLAISNELGGEVSQTTQLRRHGCRQLRSQVEVQVSCYATDSTWSVVQP